MSNTNIPSASHEIAADQADMSGADAREEFVSDDTFDGDEVLDDSLEPADDDVLADEEDDLLDDDDLDEDDDDLLDDILVVDDEDDDDL